MGRWHALNNNYKELKKYLYVEEYVKAWDQGRAEKSLLMLLEHGALTAQQQFQLNHREAYEHFRNITNTTHQGSKKP